MANQEFKNALNSLELRLKELAIIQEKHSRTIEEQNKKQEIFIAELLSKIDQLSNENLRLKRKFKEMAHLLEELAEEVIDLKSYTSSTLTKYEALSPDVSHPLSTNGQLIWSIDKLQDKIKSAEKERKVYCSQAFFTRQFGYKFQASAYLNGLGKWENKFIVLSLDLCSSPWDPVLKWPCRIDASFTLVDQTEERANAKDETKLFKKITVNNKRKFLRTFIPKETLKENNYISKDSILIVISVKENEVT